MESKPFFYCLFRSISSGKNWKWKLEAAAPGIPWHTSGNL